VDLPSLDAIRAAVGERFIVDALAGQGGMGAIYRGRHATLGSPVAIKVLPVLAEQGSDELARFQREAKLAANLPHPHIVPVFEFQVKDGLAFFVMPFVEGESLAQYIQEHGRLDVDRVRELLRHVGSALAFAHERGVVHRDIKPANLLRETASGRWLVADFGVARASGAREDGITRTGMVVGTPAYMAPEQAFGVSDVDGRADLYALAAVASEALTGTRTDTLKDRDDAEVLLRAARPDIPRPLAKALTAGLALDRDRRPADVREWLGGIEAADSGISLAATLTATPARRRGSWMGVAFASLAGIAIAIGVWRRSSDASDVTVVTTVAIEPVSASGAFDSPELRSGIRVAVEDQLRWLPQYQVVRSDVADRFTVDEYLVVRATPGPGGGVHIEVQVRDAPQGRLLRGSEVEGPLDSLAGLVTRLMTDAFASELARQQVGWVSSLPRGGMAAVGTYFEAERLFRSGAYDRAIDRFNDVIARDSTFAPAYFRRMLSELLRLRPTRAADALSVALDAAVRFGDRLDPTNASLLAAYRTLIVDGRIAAAHDTLRSIVEQSPTATDAWFLLGYIEFYLGSLLDTPVGAARLAFGKAAELNPSFAAALAQLALIAVLEDDRATAQRYFARYLAIDSVSVWAEVMRMADSVLYQGPRASLAALGSLDARPSAALEILAFGGGSLGQRAAERAVARRAIDVLLARAASEEQRATAFRMRIASSLGSGRLASADSALRAAARLNVPRSERDRWVVLGDVTGVARLDDAGGRAAAAARLLGDEADVVAQWLVARWYAVRDPAAAARAAARVRQIAEQPPADPFARSLDLDLRAHAALAAGDTGAAYGAWATALAVYSVGRVPFGLVGSLWPLRVGWARVAAARGDHQTVVAVTSAFPRPSGFNDQVAWSVVLPLRAEALRATGDELGARTIYRQLISVMSEANGAGISLRDSVARLP